MAGTGFRRWGWLLIVAVLSAAVLVAAGGPRGHGRPAQAANDPTDDTVTVVGVGTADGSPDTLTVDFGVDVHRSTVQQALNADASAARKVLASLKQSGVDDKHVSTTDLQLNPRYDRHGQVIGYEASETVEARITPLAHAGRTISAAATSAGNDVTVNGLFFDIANDAALISQARANAFDDANKRATQYASLSGRSLGRVEHITERVDNPQPEFFGASAAATPGALKAVPIRGGQQTLSVRVTVIWQLS